MSAPPRNAPEKVAEVSLADLIARSLVATSKWADLAPPTLSKDIIDALTPTLAPGIFNPGSVLAGVSPASFLPPRIPSKAEIMCERLVKQIADFEARLDPNEEIGGRLVSAPGLGVFHIEDIGYSGPDVIIFHGINEHGRPVELLQHCSQLSLLLSALPKEKDTPRRIGFMLEQKLAK